MNTYYIHNGNESSGPFGLEELKSKKITLKTPVWCQGMEDWKYAGEVAELTSVIMVIPPPFTSIKAPLQTPKTTEKERIPEIFGINRNIFFLVAIILVLIIGTISFNFFENNRKNELDQKNTITERDNQQFQLQEKEINEQKSRIAEQDRIEAERILAESNQQLSNNVLQVQNTIVDYNRNLEKAKKKLIDTTDFEFLRSPEEKNEAISLVQKEVEYWKNEIDKLKKEKDQLFLELEKTQKKVSAVSVQK